MEATYKLTKAQSEIFNNNSRFRVAACGRRFGKNLGILTPILTTSGWKKMSEILPGDYVFGADGKPTLVINVTDTIYDDECFEVVFSDGSKVIAGATHEWKVDCKRYRKQKGRKARDGVTEYSTDHIKRIYTTREMIDAGVQVKRNDNRKEWRFAIPTAEPLELPTKNLSIDPYVLGSWLGDGTSAKAEICGHPDDMEELTNYYVYPHHIKKPLDRDDIVYAVFNVKGVFSTKLLKDRDLFKHKRIPEEYFFGSYHQRLALLQGLMDSDGTASKNGNCEFTSCSYQLAHDFFRLLMTMGIKGTIIMGEAKLYGRKTSDKWRICFTTDQPVFKLKRKLERIQGRRKKDIKRRFIWEINKISPVPTKCIEVDNEDRLYLCGTSLIPTHNSYLSVFELLQAASIPNSQCWYVTSSYRAAKQIIWTVLKEIIIPTGFVTKINESELMMTLTNKSRIQLKGAESRDSLRGVGLDFLVIDEAAFVDERVWKEILRPTLSDTGGSALFISSPSGRDWFYKLWLLGSDPEFPDWASWQYTTLEGGNVPEEEIESARRDLDERTFQQEYEAKFTDYYGVIYYNFDPEQSSSDYAKDIDKPLHLGIDMNIDPMSCVVAQRVYPKGDNGFSSKDNSEFHIVDEIVLYSSNTDELAQEIKNRYNISQCTLYPDPACIQRKTSAGGKTDLSILQSAGFKVRMRNRHPAVRDRINSVNSLLKNSDGRRRLYVNRKCRHLRESLERQTYKEGSSIPDKSRGYDHLADALGYMCLGGNTPILTEEGLIPIMYASDRGRIKDLRGEWCDYQNLGIIERDQNVMRITFGGHGITYSVICTPDHQFLTVFGFFEAEDLRIGERMCKPLPHYTPPPENKNIHVIDDINDLLEDIGPKTQEGLTQMRVVEKELLEETEDVWCLHVPRFHNFQLGDEDYPIISKNCEYIAPVRGGATVAKRKVGGF